jgi:sigma-70-like protein
MLPRCSFTQLTTRPCVARYLDAANPEPSLARPRRTASSLAIPHAGARVPHREAFEALVRAHYERLANLAYRYLQSDAAAEDAVQEVLLKVWRRRPPGRDHPHSGGAARALPPGVLGREMREGWEQRGQTNDPRQEGQ